MKIIVTTNPPELAEMGFSSTQELSAAILDRLDQEGVEHDGRRVELAGFDVDAKVLDPAAMWENDPATDLDTLITFLMTLRAQQGNIPVKHHPMGSGGQLIPASIRVSRMGLSGQPRLVSRGGNPVLVIG